MLDIVIESELKAMPSPDDHDINYRAHAATIVDGYSQQLLSLIRVHLADYVDHRVDPEDILQNVWLSFFRSDFRVRSDDQLFALLMQISIYKAHNAVRFHHQQKRNVQSEIQTQAAAAPADVHAHVRQPLRRATSVQHPDPEGAAEPDSFFDKQTLQLMTHGATAEQAATFVELFNSLSSTLQIILGWRLEGLTESEIADRLQCTRRTVTRRMALIRTHLQKHLTASEIFPSA